MQCFDLDSQSKFKTMKTDASASGSTSAVRRRVPGGVGFEGLFIILSTTSLYFGIGTDMMPRMTCLNSTYRIHFTPMP